MTNLHRRFAALDLLDAPEQWDDIQERANADQQHPARPARRIPWWRGPAVAFAAAAIVLLAGAMLWMLKAEPETDVVGPIAADDVLEPDWWNPILADTTAGPVLAPARCEPVSVPNVADAASWPSPFGSWGLLRAVFDPHVGEMIYDDSIWTWLFDVCTNTWTRVAQDDGGGSHGWIGALVYDSDSEAAVSFGVDDVRVLDRGTGIWIASAYPDTDSGVPLATSVGDRRISGAVYDPVSGLIIVQVDYEPLLWAYDVDTDTWTEVGRIPETLASEAFALLGYSRPLDRLIVTTPGEEETLLVDPRTGVTAVVATRSPWYPVSHGFPDHFLAQTAESVLVDYPGFPLCEFNSRSLAWDDCHRYDDGSPLGLAAVGRPTAIVEDTINNRLLLLYFRAPDDSDGIWAYARDTDDWDFIPVTISD
jgi:hypothetical protein